MTDAIQPSATSTPLGLTFPDFISYRSEGVFVGLSQLSSGDDLVAFVDRMHLQGARFAGLDYALTLKLLFDTEALPVMAGSSPEVRIAAKIVYFPDQRRDLYRGVKVLQGGKTAEYMFEPVSIEVSREVHVYGTPDAKGLLPVTGFVTRLEDQPASLDFDEFFAAMWLKGVEFGLDETAVREIIASGKTARITVARQLDATPGQDAEISEVSPDLHRDNSPRIMADGKVDLGQFKNRFPQIAMGVNLLRKIPCVPGKRGRKVSGEAIEPKLPRDLDLSKLVSSGTRIEKLAEGECIVSTMAGFLTLDPRSNKISVTEKLENKAGISVKTTGDLVLSVDEFIEHGEVQEGRVVRGRNMLFRSDVFGRVISEGGNIELKKNLSGGIAETFSGNIKLNGRVSRSVVRSADGEVTAGFCESSTLIGKRVRVEHAVNCEIVADEIVAGVIEGCMTLSKRIHVLKADERRGKENLVTMLVPDLEGFDKHVDKLQLEIVAIRKDIADKTQQLALVNSDAEFVKYLGLANRIKSGAIQLTPEQAPGWRKLAEKHVLSQTRAVRLPLELDALNTALAHAEEALELAIHAREVAGVEVNCTIDNVLGQTSGQTLRLETGAPAPSAMQPSQIRELLLRVDGGKQRIFSGDVGSIQWQLP